ncbi:hypothetical protein J6590_082922 [Homalodisca vitripennis]|nr:hypothetical protein J6590_082922 [Homalodisca vitripennis]
MEECARTYQKYRRCGNMNPGDDGLQGSSRRRANISWMVTREPAKKRSPHKTTNLRGWNANKFDAEIFQEAFNSEPITANSAHEETEEVMRRVALACDATMTRKRLKTNTRRCTGGIATLPEVAREPFTKEEKPREPGKSRTIET